MKKVFFKTMMVAVLAGSAMSSCVNEVEDLYNPEYMAKMQQYEAQWRIKFGRIDPNEDWGFGADASSEPKAMTRGWANAGANMWGGFVEVPAPLTEEQKAMITNWFETNQKPQGISVNWSEFFAQQVSSNDYGKKFMSYLTVGTEDVHMNNFNGGDCDLNQQIWGGELSNPNDQNSKVFHADRIQFVQSEETSRFGYKCTLEENSSMYYDKYVIVPGEDIDASLAGMFFLGYDFVSNGNTAEKQIAADGYYSDWIIKITPAIYKNAKRIICEDLGSIGDFDFNDVVFDVVDAGWRWDATANANIREAIVTIHAAGGTLPIYVGGVEVHAALGVDTGVMVNTGASNGVNTVIANYRVRINEGDDVRNIPVVVESSEAGFYTLEAPQGKAPHKICVSTDFKWTSERTNIKDVYTTFPSEGWENVVAE